MQRICEIKILRILFDIKITKARTKFSSQFNGKTFDIAIEMQQNCKIKVSRTQMNRKTDENTMRLAHRLTHNTELGVQSVH